MKTRLLRKLRKRFARKYTIRRCVGGWGLYYGYRSYDFWRCSDLETAKACFLDVVRRDILDYVSSFRKKFRYLNRSITYYPW